VLFDLSAEDASTNHQADEKTYPYLSHFILLF